MTTLTLRRIKDHFVITGPDIEPMRFKSRPEARGWCRLIILAHRSERSVGARRRGWWRGRRGGRGGRGEEAGGSVVIKPAPFPAAR